jgi:hypothetical protein
MKSVQLNFFIHPVDLKAIEMFLIERNTLFIKQPNFDVADPYADSLKYPKSGAREFDRVCLVDPRFVDRIYYRNVERQGYYVVEVEDSNVLDFNRGGFSPDGEKLNRARLYFTKFFDNEDGVKITKDEGFITWAIGIISDIKKVFLQPIANGRDYFFSPRAISWMEETHASLDTPGLSLTKETVK